MSSDLTDILAIAAASPSRVPISSTCDTSTAIESIKDTLSERDSAYCKSILRKIEENGVFTLLDPWDKVEIETWHDHDTQFRHQRSIFKVARMSLEGQEPIVFDARIAHLGQPRLSPCFELDDDGTIYLKDNPYLSSPKGQQQNIEYIQAVLMMNLDLYFFLSSLQNKKGYDATESKIIKRITVYPKEGEMFTEYVDSLNDSTLRRLKDTIDAYTASDRLINDFLSNMIPGMRTQVQHEFKKVIHNGEPMLKNHFEPKPWEDAFLQMNPASSKLLFELSLETDPHSNCPAYIRHYDRLSLWFKSLGRELFVDDMPLTLEANGVDIANVGEFSLSSDYTILSEYFMDRLEALFDDKGIVFKDLLEKEQALVN